MRFLPTGVHAVLDDMTGILLIALPCLFGFTGLGVATWLPIVAGAGLS